MATARLALIAARRRKRPSQDHVAPILGTVRSAWLRDFHKPCERQISPRPAPSRLYPC